MKIHLTNGCIYYIPKGTKYANISIAFTETELQTLRIPVRRIRRETELLKSKEDLIGFSRIGYEEIEWDNLQIERHWFIDKGDLNKCKISYTGLG